MSRGWICSSLSPKEFNFFFFVLMLPEVFRNHICCSQPNTWTSSWGTLSKALKPVINSVTSWDNDLRLDGRPPRALKVALMFCSWKRSEDRGASVWFPPSWGHKGVYFWFLPISQLFARLFFFSCLVSKQASYQLFLRTSWRRKTWSLVSHSFT